MYLCVKVKAITREIKELDTAKTNLTYSIKTLEKLSMLVRSIEDLSWVDIYAILSVLSADTQDFVSTYHLSCPNLIIYSFRSEMSECMSLYVFKELHACVSFLDMEKHVLAPKWLLCLLVWCDYYLEQLRIKLMITFPIMDTLLKDFSFIIIFGRNGWKWFNTDCPYHSIIMKLTT